jgi:hypothetical protein
MPVYVRPTPVARVVKPAIVIASELMPVEPYAEFKTERKRSRLLAASRSPLLLAPPANPPPNAFLPPPSTRGHRVTTERQSKTRLGSR